MEYKKIIAITGLSGLYELVSSKTDGAIVRSLDDNSTKFIASRTHNFSHLESIEVYTTKENVNLVDILTAMEQSNEALPDTKNNKAINEYFQVVYPDLDFERVYASDMKKMVKWYEVLRNKVEFRSSEQTTEESLENTPLTEEVIGEAIDKPQPDRPE